MISRFTGISRITVAPNSRVAVSRSSKLITLSIFECRLIVKTQELVLLQRLMIGSGCRGSVKQGDLINGCSPTCVCLNFSMKDAVCFMIISAAHTDTNPVPLRTFNPLSSDKQRSCDFFILNPRTVDPRLMSNDT